MRRRRLLTNLFDIPLLALICFFVGALASMTGIGGGVLMVPILSLIFNLPTHKAVGTSLSVIIFTSIASTFAYYRQKRIDYKIGFVMSSATIPGSLTGAYLTTLINERELGIIFALFLIFVALRMILNLNTGLRWDHALGSLGSLRRKIVDADGEVFEYSVSLPLGFSVGFLGGMSSGFLGIGGGSIMVPILHIVMNLPMHVTVATSMFIMIFSSVFGTAQHAAYGNVVFEYTIPMALGVIFGAQLGAHVAKRVSGKSLKRLFAVVLILVGVRLLSKFIM